MEYLSRGGGYTTLVEYLSRGGGVHHLSGTFFHRGGGTPPEWNICPQGGGGGTTSMEHLSRGGGYTTSVEYLCLRGVHSNLVEYLSKGGGVHHLGGIFIQRGGHTTSVEYLSRGGGGTPPQWNIFPGLPFSPMLHFSTLFFSFGGAVPLCCMVSHSSQLSIFMMVFFVVGGCVAGGGVADFSLSLSEMKEGREGSGTTLLSDFC